MNTKLTYLNHASVLLELGGWFIWTDPFYESPAFGSWLSSPPMAIHPTQILSQAVENPDRLLILVSHGHDDHLDDKLVSLFSSVTVATTRFNSKGVINRLRLAGFNKVVELDQMSYSFGPFVISGYVNANYSRDDSIQVIRSADLTFVHANDCWFPWGDEIWAFINESSTGITIHGSQVQNATGSFPFGYKNLADHEAVILNRELIARHAAGAAENFSQIKADYFLNYAGHVFIYSGNMRVDNNSGYIDRETLLNMSPDTYFKDRVLDMRAGDTFCAGTVIKSIANLNTSDRSVKIASRLFWDSYKPNLARDNNVSIYDSELIILLEKFATKFEQYVLARCPEISYFPEILEWSVYFNIEGVGSHRIQFPFYPSHSSPVFESFWNPNLASLILKGNLNWEVAYVGALGEHKKSPPSINDISVIRWLAMFGYLWQNKFSRETLI